MGNVEGSHAGRTATGGSKRDTLSAEPEVITLPGNQLPKNMHTKLVDKGDYVLVRFSGKKGVNDDPDQN